MEKLTPKQSKALEFIRDRVSSTGSPPTLRELCGFMGYNAVGSAQDLIKALRRKGFLTTPDKQAARSLILTELGRSFGRGIRAGMADAEAFFSVPCLGSVPAGNPLEAIEEVVGTISVSPSLFSTPRPSPDQLFALRARGLSMIGAGIMDGDWLVVKSQQEANQGNIVVARIEGEATVKRLMRDDHGWFLKPENPDFPLLYASDRPFEIVGRVVALQRAFAS